MLLYDNRHRWRLIFQFYGSIYVRCWKVAICIFVYSATFHLIVWDLYPELRDKLHLEHPFAAQSLGVLIAFSVCFRTNIAWNRFWEACQEIVTMFSKWTDAYSQLQGFISSTITTKGLREPGREKELAKIEHARDELTHYFSLLSAVAVERLMRGDIRRMQMRRKNGANWNELVVFREHLRHNDLTGSRHLCRMQVLDLHDMQADLECDEEAGEAVGRRPSQEKEHEKARQETRRQSVQISAHRARQLLDDAWQMPLPIIGDLSKSEVHRLRRSKDRIALVVMWINQSVTDLVPNISVPAPIVSRVFQEVSNGALGYSQAEKLADIPFPFIFAQVLAVAMIFIATISPAAFSLITGRTYLTPFFSTVCCLSFWSLNEIAKELENPFGVEANNVPIVDYHERFVHAMAELHGCLLPLDRLQGEIVEPAPPVHASPNHTRGCGAMVENIQSARVEEKLSSRTSKRCSIEPLPGTRRRTTEQPTTTAWNTDAGPTRAQPQEEAELGGLQSCGVLFASVVPSAVPDALASELR